MKARPCVRCGSRPRWDGTFICEQCWRDPQQRKEVVEATERGGGRSYLVKTFHWVGRWGPRSEV